MAIAQGAAIMAAVKYNEANEDVTDKFKNVIEKVPTRDGKETVVLHDFTPVGEMKWKDVKHYYIRKKTMSEIKEAKKMSIYTKLTDREKEIHKALVEA